MNWEIVLWTCGTIAVMVIVGSIVMGIISAKNMKKRREDMAELQKRIKVGATILFAGGIYGKILKINKDDLLDVEVSKGVVIQISRYSIQSVNE